MKVLVLAMSSAGYGETLIGLTLARDLAGMGMPVRFVIDTMSVSLLRAAQFPYVALDAQMGPLAALLVDQEVANFRPDVIVLSDYFTYCGVFAKRFGLDPWFIDRYGVPIVPIDIWEWNHTRFAVDVFCEKHISVSERILTMDAYLRPVPLCHPTSNGDSKAFPFALQRGRPRAGTRRRDHLRRVLGLSRTDTLLLMTLARWQTLDYDDENGNLMARETPGLLRAYLNQLPASVQILTVGERLYLDTTVEATRVHHFPSCDPSRFAMLLEASDAFLGLNVAATTMTQAVYCGLPSVVLVNSRRTALAKPRPPSKRPRAHASTKEYVTWLEDHVPLYPFRLWPLGFYEFMAPMLEANSYCSTFLQVELFDSSAVARQLEAVLFDAPSRERLLQAQRDYRTEVSHLQSAGECFVSLAKAIGL